jgi:hypothetical protein
MHRLFTKLRRRETGEQCKMTKEINNSFICAHELLTVYPTWINCGEQVLSGCIHEKAARKDGLALFAA